MRVDGGVDVLGHLRRGVLLGLVAAVPLLFLWDVTNQPFAVPKLALLSVGVAVAAALRAAEVVLGASARGLRTLAVPVALVGIPTLVAWAASDYRSWALLGAYGRYEGLVPALLVAAAGALLADAFAPPSRRIAWAFAGSAAGAAAYGTLQSLGLDPFGVPVVEYAPSTIGHSNFAGGFLGIALPVALGLGASTGGRARTLALALSITISVGLLMSFSQGATAAGAGGLAVFAGTMLAPRWPRARMWGWIAAAGVAAAIAGLVLLSLVRPFHPAVPDTVRARGLWWRGAAAMGASSPVWGRGPNVYAIEGAHHRSPEDALAHDRAIADVPHSVPLSWWASAGVLGLAGFAGLAAWTVHRGVKAEGPLAAGFAAGAAAYFVQSVVSIDMTVLTLALWICLAGMAAPASRGVPSPAAPPVRRRILAAVVAVVPLATAWWAVDFVTDDARVHAATERFDSGDTAAALEAMGEVAQDGAEHYRHLYGSMLGSAALRSGPTGSDEIARMKDAFTYLDDLPDVQGMASYAENLHRWSVFDPRVEEGALVQLRRLLRFDRYSPTARVWTAEALVRLGRPSEAVDVLEEMIPLMQEHPEYDGTHPMLWGMLSVAYRYDGRVEDAEVALRRALDKGGAGSDEGDCHVLVARELARTDGAGAPRAELLESSPGLLLCKPATLALLPGYEPQERA